MTSPIAQPPEILRSNAAPIAAEAAVRSRYGAAARAREPALCCPVDYDPRYLDVIPDELIERDYGCGDPSRYVREGDTVLDLGSGGGKVCFIACQIAGRGGRVIGVDMTDDMLELARRTAPRVADRLGYSNVEFRRGRIQDLAVDLDHLESWLESHPVRTLSDLAELEAEQWRLRRAAPMIPDASIDLVVSNCVLNLVSDDAKQQMLDEIFRVLRPGGRIAIADIVSDEEVPEGLKADPELWSGCVSGAFQEMDLLRGLEKVGFYGIAIDKWEQNPFAVVEGIEFRSVTITAMKGKEGPCLEAGEAVIYRGPWKRVEDDDGHVLERGVRTAVCAKTHRILTSGPYEADTVGVRPRSQVEEKDQKPFDCSRTEPRHPRESKGADYVVSSGGRRCC